MLSEKRPATIEDLSPRTLFRDVPIKLIKRLLKEAEVTVLPLQARTRLKLHRANVEYLYIIVSGYLEVRLDSPLVKKGESFLLAFRGPEQIIGEMKAIAKRRGEAFISSSEPCELIEIPADALTKVAEMDWRIYRNICVLLIEKTYQERKRTEVIQMPEGEAQVAQALLNFLDERGAENEVDKGKKIKGVIRQSDIADYLGCDRTTVAKSLKKIKDRGVIKYPYSGPNIVQQITICDPPVLSKIARQKK